MEYNSPATKKTKTDELSYEHNPKYLMAISTDDYSLYKINPLKLAEVIDKAAGGKIIDVTIQQLSTFRDKLSKTIKCALTNEISGRYPSKHYSIQFS